MNKTGQNNSVTKNFFNMMARTLGGVPLSAMEKFARRKGREHERVIETIKAKYW